MSADNSASMSRDRLWFMYNGSNIDKIYVNRTKGTRVDYIQVGGCVFTNNDYAMAATGSTS